MTQVVKQLCLLLFLGLMFFSCESEYSRTVKRELKSGVIHEDLIFGMKIGQTRQNFYDKCWLLNKQKLVNQGPGNKFARHVMLIDSTQENSDKVEMLFYGIFDEDKIMHGMHMKMSFIKWSPWNEEYHSDKLIEALKKKYLRKYPGNDFLTIDIKDDIKAFAKVDGNRQILIYPNSDKDVTVKIQDLRQKDLPDQ